MNFTFPKLTSAVTYFVNEQSVFKPLKCISNRKFYHAIYYINITTTTLTASRGQFLTFSLTSTESYLTSSNQITLPWLFHRSNTLR